LQGVTETPTIRPDGSILDVPGYDVTTGVVFAPASGFVWSPIQPTPSQGDARAAVETLLGLLVDFPFEADGHRAVALAAMVTAIARPGIDGPAPLFLIDATTPGSGKGLLAHTVATLSTGRGAAVMVQTGSEETEKRVTSLLLASTPVILIDNVDRPLGGAAIDAALTADVWQGRRLGHSAMVTVRNRSTWLATGNNIHVRGDLVRRCLRAYLAPAVERPELLSGFRFADLIGHVKQHRGRYVSAALTLLRAYVAVGRPPVGLCAFGGFGAWSSTVRAALVWAGQPDPVETQTDLRQHADMTVEAQGAIVGSLFDVFGGVPVSVREILDRLALQHAGALTGNAKAEAAVDRLREAAVELAGDKRGEINARRLGWALRRLLGRIFDEKRLARGPSGASATWVVESVSKLDKETAAR
jgi:putative DNA primase/helicase